MVFCLCGGGWLSVGGGGEDEARANSQEVCRGAHPPRSTSSTTSGGPPSHHPPPHPHKGEGKGAAAQIHSAFYPLKMLHGTNLLVLAVSSHWHPRRGLILAGVRCGAGAIAGVGQRGSGARRPAHAAAVDLFVIVRPFLRYMNLFET